MAFRLSENLLNNLSQGAGFNAGGAMTQGLANYKKTRQEGIVNSQKQETLDIQKQNAASMMDNYRNQKENWDTQNELADRTQSELDANRTLVTKETKRSNLAEEEIARSKARTDAATAGQPTGAQETARQVEIRRLIDERQEKNDEANSMFALASKFGIINGPTGIVGDSVEFIKKTTGQGDDWTFAKIEFEGIVNKALVNGLPVGPASDNDIKLIAGGFPKGNANVEQIVEWLEMAGRVSQGAADRIYHRQLWEEKGQGIDGWTEAWEAEKVARSLALTKIDEDAAKVAADAAEDEKNMLGVTGAGEGATNDKPPVEHRRGRQTDDELAKTKAWQANYDAEYEALNIRLDNEIGPQTRVNSRDPVYMAQRKDAYDALNKQFGK